MALLVDLFGYLGVVLHGVAIVAQAGAYGSVLFLLLLARPLGARLGPDGPLLARRVARVAAWSALALAATVLVSLAMQGAVLAETAGLSPVDIAGADFALAGAAKIAAALLLAILLFSAGPGASPFLLAALVVVGLGAATLTTHAAARVDERAWLIALSFLHQAGAALWIGGIPVFVGALSRIGDPAGWALVGARFSRMSMAGVAAILLSGIGMSVAYIGDLSGLYGTAYGVMVAAKAAMLAMLLGLGFGNFRVVARLRAGGAGPVTRMKRFAEAEIGIGIAVFFAAASLTSVPPAVDLAQDRVSLAEIVERFTPRMPRLVSPDHDALALSAPPTRRDGEDAADATAHGEHAYVPGGGETPPRNAADIAWSEYNHHWAGFFVTLIGALALAAQAGWRPARHWPLVFAGLGIFLLVRADPDAWPLGTQGFWESLRDVETLQHRTFVLLIFGFAFIEWRVRAFGLRAGTTPLVFPLMCAAGGVLLLTHQHAIGNAKEQLLIEITHTPLALLALAAGWARWLELRLGPEDGRLRRAAGWIAPACLVLIGAILVLYRES